MACLGLVGIADHPKTWDMGRWAASLPNHLCNYCGVYFVSFRHIQRRWRGCIQVIAMSYVYTYPLIFRTAFSRPPRSSSGYLPSNTTTATSVVLVLELESRRSEIVNLFAKKKREKDLLAPINSSSGRHNSTRVDEGRAEIFSR